MSSFSQTEDKSTKLFGLNSVSGELSLMGQYRQQDRILKSNTTESLESSIFSGGLLLKSTGYVWHPNLLLLSLDANYNPQNKQENYLVIPDRSEVRTLQRLHLNGTFLRQKPVTLSCFVDLNRNYINNEDLTNIKSDHKKYGGTFYVKSNFIPLTLSYVNAKWDQQEIISNRTFKNEHLGIQGRINKSFSSRDNHKLSYNYNDYFRQDNSLTQVQNLTQEVSLIDNVFFDRDKRYYFSSYIAGFDQVGYNNYQRLQARENLNLKLPKRLYFNTN